MVDVDRESLTKTVDDFKSRYNDVEVYQKVIDIASEGAVQAAADETMARFGRIDIAVNNAGISGPRGPATDINFMDWKAAIDVNLHGLWLCQRAEISQMLKQEAVDSRRGRGTIVNMASMYGTVGISSPQPATAYAASKHAVVGLTKTDASTFAEHGIRINAICPGYVETPLLRAATQAGNMDGEIAKTPMKRLGTVEEIVDLLSTVPRGAR
ncbi:hypothetical protein ACJZ2D_016050 [Fusarium nematophilum]